MRYIITSLLSIFIANCTAQSVDTVITRTNIGDIKIFLVNSGIGTGADSLIVRSGNKRVVVSPLDLVLSTAAINALAGKNATLVSGTNIKTVNGSTLLGSGDLVVSGGAVAWDDITGKPTTTSWLSNSANKNFVTDAQATVIGNTSGTNTGDNATNTQYSGLAASKQDLITAGTTAQYYRGDKTFQTLDKTAVGLSNVDNTSDATKNAASVTLTNKTISGASNTLSNIPITAITNYTGYTIPFQALTSSPTDAQTVYFGNLPKAPVTAAATSKIYIRKAGTIKIAEIYSYSGTAGTNEAWVAYIRLNNTTDTQIASVSLGTSERIWSNTGLSIAVVAGDYIEIKMINPTWATNPLTFIPAGYIYIE